MKGAERGEKRQEATEGVGGRKEKGGERVPHLAYRESIATHFDRILLEVGECRYLP